MHNNPIFNELVKQGVSFPGAMNFLETAMDAQSVLSTVSNAGIPAFLSNYIDPKIIDVLFSPMKAAVITGEAKKGTWLDTVATFPLVEYDGETSSYGDYATNGMSGVNANFVTREYYVYQTVTQWGEREMEVAGLARIDWATQVNLSSILALNKFQNSTYFLGVGGIKNYGLLNDPNLNANISATAVWSLAATSAETIWEDIRRVFAQLQLQSGGNVDANASMVFACAPATEATLLKTNSYGLNVLDIMKKNYPNMRVVSAVEYNTTGTTFIAQMICDEFEGQKTAECCFGEKLRAHPIIVDMSSFKQKKSQSTLGCVIYRPALVAGITGI